MIKVNNKIIEQNHFPDNTLLMKYDGYFGCEIFDIEWHYENDGEIFALYSITQHIRRVFYKPTINLVMPYCPHARMDRVKNDEDVFTLKYFTEILNSLNFNQVEILDPHSPVCEALINNVLVTAPDYLIEKVLNELNLDLVFYPDEGAMKRYSNLCNMEYAFGIKKRDWKTGVIKGLDIAGPIDKIKGSNILIIDDICSKGGTFYHSAKTLKEAGAENIYLYITHCENTIFEGELLTSDLISHIYTTNSIFTKEHEKITVLNVKEGEN